MATCEPTTSATPVDAVVQPEHLLVFARFPEAGKTKTRLIPALGAERAAEVSRHLTQRTFETAQRFSAQRRCAVTICFSGGSTQIMQTQFGTDHRYAEQVGQYLGSRLAHATQRAFDQGARRVVVIGTDCAELTVADLTAAFDRLREHDLVLGPAHDGGYYLIGLRYAQPLLFENIDWGSERVLQQTKHAAGQFSTAQLSTTQSSTTQLSTIQLSKSQSPSPPRACSLVELRTLSDIDEAEDLLPLRSPDRPYSAGLFTTVPGRLSIVIPALDEAEHLPATLRSIGTSGGPALEVIVVDGGSRDTTLAIAQQHGCRTLSSKPGRARQMNAGAAIATGENLLFLHADTLLPSDYQVAIDGCLSVGHIAGAFRLSIAASSLGLRWVAWGANARSRYRQFPYGDQGIFLRSQEFFRVGGYRDLSLMEDFEFIDRLRRRGRVGLLSQSITTSARRWQRRGVLKTTLINQLCIVAYRLGYSTTTIAKLYR